MADQLWMSLFILHRVVEDFGISVTLDPKLISGDWNGAGFHTNFSTEAMRNVGGYVVIEETIQRLAAINHRSHIAYYDPKESRDNQRRLTGKDKKHETASMHRYNSMHKWGFLTAHPCISI